MSKNNVVAMPTKQEDGKIEIQALYGGESAGGHLKYHLQGPGLLQFKRAEPGRTGQVIYLDKNLAQNPPPAFTIVMTPVR